MSYQQTILTYPGPLPTITGTVTLFNSATMYTPGSFHTLGLHWFQFTLRAASDNATATGTITGDYSVDKGVTWIPFYTLDTEAADDDLPPDAGDVQEDEVYVGMFRDVRFQYTNAVEVLTVFEVQMALLCDKATSKALTSAVIGGNL